MSFEKALKDPRVHSVVALIVSLVVEYLTPAPTKRRPRSR